MYRLYLYYIYIYILLLIAAMIIINCLFGTLKKSFESCSVKEQKGTFLGMSGRMGGQEVHLGVHLLSFNTLTSPVKQSFLLIPSLNYSIALNNQGIHKVCRWTISRCFPQSSPGF